MAFKRPKARILERTITAGNGPYTTTTIDTSYNRFSSFMSVGDTTEGYVVEPGVAFWTGILTYSAANQITLTTVEETTGTFGAGTKEIGSGPMAARSALPQDIAGAIATGGSSTAYTVTSFRVYDTLVRLNGNMIAFTPHTTSTNAAGADVTLSVDGLAAKSIRSQSGVPLPGGSLIAGTPYIALYNNSDAVFYLHNTTNPYSIPLGGGLDYWGATAPSSVFALAQGQAISTTTFATLFALFGTTYNTGGEPGGTFRIPDKIGRVSAMVDTSSTRISSSYFGGNPANRGAVGGLESNTLSVLQMPVHSHANTLGDTGHFHDSFGGNTARSYGNVGNGGAVVTGIQLNNGDDGVAVTDTKVTGMTITNASNGSGNAHNNVQPTIVCNYIIRVL